MEKKILRQLKIYFIKTLIDPFSCMGVEMNFSSVIRQGKGENFRERKIISGTCALLWESKT